MSLEFQSMKDLTIVPPEDLPKNLDGLELLLISQKMLNKNVYPLVLNNIGVIEATPENTEQLLTAEVIKEKLTKEYLLAIIREACEALDMINSKSWKRTRKEVDVRELKFELIDINFFLLSLYDIWNMTRDEVLGIYIAKFEENQRRFKNGY